MFILEEMSAFTVVSSKELLSFLHTLFIKEKTLSTGAEVPGREYTYSNTSSRLGTEIFSCLQCQKICVHISLPLGFGSSRKYVSTFYTKKAKTEQNTKTCQTGQDTGTGVSDRDCPGQTGTFGSPNNRYLSFFVTE
uniref:Uncharacterized protein n=1 Tax=Cacopsylla melanoneura TaxID=428564 RepID=A0A8D8TE03_9HEMI